MKTKYKRIITNCHIVMINCPDTLSGVKMRNKILRRTVKMTNISKCELQK